MKPGSFSQTRARSFDTVKRVGLTLSGVEAAIKYDGSPVLKLGGCFVAGLATHRSAEPDSIVVRVGLEDRAWLLEDAPETYYLTDYYRPYPIVLVRLSRVDRDALRDLLSVSCRLAAGRGKAKGGPSQRRAAGSSATAVRTRS